MNILKKLAINVHSQIETLADSVENREAISSAYIREHEQKVAYAKTKLAQTNAEIARLTDEISKGENQVQIWADRARKIHRSDETKALECVARMKQEQENLSRLKKSLKEIVSLKNKMENDIGQVLDKLEDLKRRHRDLVCRQACNTAQHTFSEADSKLQNDVENLYTRWETDVTAEELRNKTGYQAKDQLLDEFEQSERDQSLRDELQHLLSSTESTQEEK